MKNMVRSTFLLGDRGFGCSANRPQRVRVDEDHVLKRPWREQQRQRLLESRYQRAVASAQWSAVALRVDRGWDAGLQVRAIGSFFGGFFLLLGQAVAWCACALCSGWQRRRLVSTLPCVARRGRRLCKRGRHSLTLFLWQLALATAPFASNDRPTRRRAVCGV